jgi:branched-chain amino acid aminotransferase
MIHRTVFHNGRMLPVEEVRLSPGQAGLLSGWGLFTTIRIIEGLPFAFERHWQRLTRDAEKTHCPFPFDEETVRAQLLELLRANQVREGCARIYAIYNQFGLWRSSEEFPQTDLVMYSSDLPSHRDHARLALREHGRHAASPLAGVKVTSWLNNLWSLHEAVQAGFDEVVLLNERGEVSECTAANIFCARGGRVATPPLSSGCLAGITRSVLLEIGPPMGIPFEERTLFPGELFSAEEVFISSTNRNVIPVTEISGRSVGSAQSPLMNELEKAFIAYIRNYIDNKTALQGRL